MRKPGLVNVTILLADMVSVARITYPSSNVYMPFENACSAALYNVPGVSNLTYIGMSDNMLQIDHDSGTPSEKLVEAFIKAGGTSAVSVVVTTA